MIRSFLPRSTEDLIHWYERYVSPVSLLIGFLIDVIAVQALDLFQYSFVLLFHLFLSGAGIVILHYITSHKLGHPLVLRLVPFLPVVIQFSFGGLFSGFVLLYARSAGVALNWIFIVLLAALLIGNERFRKLYTTFPVQVGIWYFALFSFLIVYAPIVSKILGTATFIVGGFISLGVTIGYIFAANTCIPQVIRATRRELFQNIIGIYAVINALYFLNAIPPLPLALKDAGVFHSIVRENGSYAVTYEPLGWSEWYRRYSRVFHYFPGDAVYVYTSVFAPSGISTTLIHEWQRYDEREGAWVTEENIGFAMSGGRDGGYRGYTLKRDISDGKWRVNVKTVYGQLIERVVFTVEKAAGPFPLEQGMR